ncbi:hypothetical protein [Streptomyces sp. enrichment culture]|uniref:linalool dehydratase/isomerase domain-containing protein n=1 Tax=Streptomyces sp. enrichment culture TaxID=1795815 RepID=UPI003F555D0A
MTATLTGPPGMGVDLSSVPRLDDVQIGHLRHFENLAFLPDGDWSRMGGADPGQEWLDAYRYQLAQMAYALALTHYHHLPAAPAAVRPAFERLIEKMLRRDVWGYWRETSRSGRLVDPDLTELREAWTDPVVKENIMYSGHLYAMVGLHSMLFDDDRYDEPGALTFDWNPIFQGLGPERYEYRRSTLGDAIYWQMVENGWLGVACEPNCVFIVCNQFPMLGFRFQDLRDGTDRATEATTSYRAAWDRKGMYDAQGLQHKFWRIRQDDYVDSPDIGNPSWTASVMNAWNRDIVREVYARQLRGALRSGPDGTLTPYSPSVATQAREALAAGKSDRLPEDLTHRWKQPTFGYLAAGLSEVGDERLAGVLAHADRFMRPTWERGGLYYPRHDTSFDGSGNMTYVDPLTGNVLLGYARLNVPDGLWSLYSRPWDAEHFTGPSLVGMSGALDVLRAFHHQESRTLILTVRGRDDAATDAVLDIAGLPPGRPCTLWQDGREADPATVARTDDGLRVAMPVHQETTLALRWE